MINNLHYNTRSFIIIE